MIGYFGPPPPTATIDTILERLGRPVSESPHVVCTRDPAGHSSVRSVYRDREGSISVHDVSTFELGWRVRQAGDRHDDIDKRLAEAVYESRTFADYVGA
jgi:hypothetical protein